MIPCSSEKFGASVGENERILDFQHIASRNGLCFSEFEGEKSLQKVRRAFGIIGFAVARTLHIVVEMLVIGEIEQNDLVFKNLEPHIVFFVKYDFVSVFGRASVVEDMLFRRDLDVFFAQKRRQRVKYLFCYTLNHRLLILSVFIYL